MTQLPDLFVYLTEVDPSILQDIKYYADDNFIGRRIRGYEAPCCILTLPAARALAGIQQTLLPQQLSLKVYDGYRPQRAVDDFIAWTNDPNDQKMKAAYYPRVSKADFFKLQYLAMKSSHSRGSTVDLTIVRLHQNGTISELPMGTPFDYMDERSHPLTYDVPPEARENRLLLKRLMEAAGFQGVETEWWHFTLRNEPYPDRYFDFPIG